MIINDVEFTVGADPELFVSKNGVFTSGHNLVPGTKRKPHIVNNGAVQVDGLALEFNIDPCKTTEEFDNNLDSVMSQLKDMIPGYEFMDESSVIFSEKFLDNIPKKALVMGCESDYNAYSLTPNPKPNQKDLMRTAGGHTHIGGFFTDNPFGKDHFETSARLARILDETLGLPSLVWDQDDKRRSMYGQAGCFRPKTYGMEYRTLSNKWLFNKKVRAFVFEGVEKALKLMFNPAYEVNPDVSKIINTSDRSSSVFKEHKYVKEAQELLGV